MWYRNSGWLLVGIATIHNLLGVVLGWDVLQGMAEAGFWNTVERDGQLDYARSAILWFLMLGAFWWVLGVMMQQWLRRIGSLPRWLGYALLLAGCLVAFVLPQSGAWFFLPLGLLVAFGAAKTELKPKQEASII
ncbi:MAG: DUF6463 family protein [Oceanospirillum sp.]|nr:DUF6463 family protein [Oceanospirillum sp.]